jgi:hypothetical protein|uniref:Wound-inducible basic protein family protein n=1 Tax=Myoviridae sp. cteo515 TaxID=2823550 RepID=A0A8S5LBI1_9CAUD|nr:MAG TPA: wound-inducible basic protein family protein [Myoviridae sp. cteo515]
MILDTTSPLFSKEIARNENLKKGYFRGVIYGQKKIK